MKRIIDGVTYNTDTATLMAERYEDGLDEDWTVKTELFQGRGGMYFLVETWERQFTDQWGKEQTRTRHEWFVVGDAAAARKRCEDEGLTIVRDIADMPPEAEAGEAMATVYVRMPPALKTAIEERAEEDKTSTNVFALRCFEECLDGFPEEIAAIWHHARVLTTSWSTDRNEDADLKQYKLKTAIAALEEVGDLVEKFAKRKFGTGDLVKVTGYEPPDLFEPYPR